MTRHVDSNPVLQPTLRQPSAAAAAVLTWTETSVKIIEAHASAAFALAVEGILTIIFIVMILMMIIMIITMKAV